MNQMITSLTNPRIITWLKLKTTKGRREQQAFIVAGWHLVEMALARKMVMTVLTLEQRIDIPPHIEQIIVTDKIIKQLSDQVTPEGIVAICRNFVSTWPTSSGIVYLDGVGDPGNVGTILRSAVAFGFTDVMFGPNTASMYHPKTVAASQGALFELNIIESTMVDLLKLKEQNYHLIGTLLDDKATPLASYHFPMKFVLILGSEGHGISLDIINLLDERLYIPISGIESLNVAMAASICFYEISRQIKR